MSSKMTNLLLPVLFFSSVLLLPYVCEEQCPPIYMRFSQQHSCSQSKNSSCPIFQSEVGPADIKQIVDLHNMYRNLVATGAEKRAGGMPQAADMMEMVWDLELATIAQRRAEQCIYAHDCSDCRRVENFPVGQNIGRTDKTCPTGVACDTNCQSDWAAIIKLFYDEVAVFNQTYLNSVAFPPQPVFGHFTQIVWAKTWRIGCGYVAYKKENGCVQIYVCNYGPTGNIINNPVYETGPPCERCPVNSCCGNTCNSTTEYPGLCRMNKHNEAPIYRTSVNYTFFCDFRSTDGDCSYSVIGSDTWRFVHALGGTYVEIVLNGGETTTLIFGKVIPAKKGLCLTVTYRFGPALNGMKTSGRASATFDAGNNRSSTLTLPTPRNKEFFRLHINIGWRYDTLVSINFSVPAGDPLQFFDIQLVTAKQEKCSN